VKSSIQESVRWIGTVLLAVLAVSAWFPLGSFSWFRIIFSSVWSIGFLVLAWMFYKRNFAPILTVGAFLFSVELWSRLSHWFNGAPRLVGLPTFEQQLRTHHEFSPGRDLLWHLWGIATMILSIWIAAKTYRWLRRLIDLLKLPVASEGRPSTGREPEGIGSHPKMLIERADSRSRL